MLSSSSYVSPFLAFLLDLRILVPGLLFPNIFTHAFSLLHNPLSLLFPSPNLLFLSYVSLFFLLPSLSFICYSLLHFPSFFPFSFIHLFLIITFPLCISFPSLIYLFLFPRPSAFHSYIIPPSQFSPSLALVFLILMHLNTIEIALQNDPNPWDRGSWPLLVHRSP